MRAKTDWLSGFPRSAGYLTGSHRPGLRACGHTHPHTSADPNPHCHEGPDAYPRPNGHGNASPGRDAGGYSDSYSSAHPYAYPAGCDSYTYGYAATRQG